MPATEISQRTRGVCLSCRSIDRMRDTSFCVRVPLGLNSHSQQMRSHSWPGTLSSRSWINSASASLVGTAIRCAWADHYAHRKRDYILHKILTGFSTSSEFFLLLPSASFFTCTGTLYTTVASTIVMYRACYFTTQSNEIPYTIPS